MKKFEKSSKFPFNPSPEMDEYILWVNDKERDLGWKADLCRLTRNHTLYDK